MSIGAAPSLALDVVPLPAERASGALSPREATLRSAATACLAGIALMQAIGLPSLSAHGGRLAIFSAAAMALCLRAAYALVTAPASAARALWRTVAATGALVLAGWAVPRAVALPIAAGAAGGWAAMPGAACAVLAAACVALAAAGAPPTLRGVATTAALLVALGPGAGALLVAAGPGPAGGEAAIAADVHVHAHSTAAEPDILLRRGPKGNHYVTPVPRPAHPPTLALLLVAAAAAAFVAGAVGHLRLRSAPVPPGAGAGAEGAAA